MENPNEENQQQFIIDRLYRIIDYVQSQSAPLWGNREDGHIVSLKEISSMVDDAITCLPDSVRKANSILVEENAILEAARCEAEEIEEDARRQESNIVASANDYKQKVEEYAKKHVNDAKQYECQKKDEADQYYADRRKEADVLYENTIDKAKRDAESIIEEAKAKAEELVSESEITKKAEERANDLRKRSLLWSKQICDNAKSIADDVMDRLLGTLKEYENAVMSARIDINDEGGQPDSDNNRYTTEDDTEEYGDDEERYTDEDRDYKGPFSKLSDLFKRT